VKAAAGPKLELRDMPLSALKPAPYNPRTITPKAAKGLRASLKRFGLVQPIVWNRRSKHVVGGHQRLDALRELGKIEIMARPIRNHEAPEVYDPFLGSGATLVAAEQLDRACFGLEIEPRYCDVIVERWQNLTGQKATRA
jgi:hypothetical protein